MLHVLGDWQYWNICTQAPAADQAEPLPGGLTNQSFLLHLDGGDYVLRLEAGNSEALDIHRDVEYRIHQTAALAGLVPKILYRSRDNNRYWIREYLPGHLLSIDQLTAACLEEMVLLLKKLHSLPVDNDIPRLSIADKAERYWQVILAAETEPGALATLKADLQNMLEQPPGSRVCLCHLDPTLGNWVRTERGLQLLDWEYASLGHPLWDLAAICQDARLSDEQQEAMLKAYGFSLRGHKKRQWQQAKAQMNYLAALWYCAQGIWNARELETYLLTLRALNRR